MNIKQGGVLSQVFISSKDLKQKWPEALQIFLERQVHFEDKAGNGDSNLIYKIGKLVNITEVPTRVLGCSNPNGDMVYLCEWRNSITKFVVPSNVANAKFPNVVNDFLESRVDITERANPKYTHGNYLFILFIYL